MKPRLWRAAAVAALLCVAATALAACGAGSGGAAVRLTITRDVGARSLLELENAKRGPGDALGLLRSNASVRADAAGRVEAINGLAGDWTLYVNGIRSDQRARKVDVNPGDRLWWDLHDRSIPPSPAVVGAFPEPFVHGTGGRKLPVRVECAEPQSAPCDAVAHALTRLGVVAGRSALSHSAADNSLRVLVGPWRDLRGLDAEAEQIDAGPASSGVFARFDTAGTRLVVLDERGRPARTLGAGTGFVAATRARDRKPVWYVTGTDDAGVQSAARALDESALSDRFALAISADLPVRVPLGPGGGAAAP
jgi:hypothetical protein